MRETVRQIGFSAKLAAAACLLITESVQSQGTLYVSSFGGNQVLRYDATTGAFVDTLISNAGGQLVQPHGVFDRGTDLLVASAQTDEILRYNRVTGELLGTFIGPATGIDYPVYMAIGPDELMYVSSQQSDEIFRFNRDTGALVDVFVSAGSGGLSGPSGFAFGPDGRLYLAGRFSDTVTAYNGTTGAFEETIADPNDGLGAGNTFGLQFGDNDDLYFASNNQTFRYDLDDDTFTTIAASGIGLEPGPGGGMFVATANNLRLIDTGDNSIGPTFLGAGGVINTLNFFHFSFLNGPSADFDVDGDVDTVDLSTWETAYGITDLGDTDGDGDSDGLDFLAWQQQYGSGLASAGAIGSIVPEPDSCWLLLASLVTMLSCRTSASSRAKLLHPHART